MAAETARKTQKLLRKYPDDIYFQGEADHWTYDLVPTTRTAFEKNKIWVLTQLDDLKEKVERFGYPPEGFAPVVLMGKTYVVKDDESLDEYATAIALLDIDEILPKPKTAELKTNGPYR